jgi:AraC-like DNA-binding protein
MMVRESRPCVELASFVASFGVREERLGAAERYVPLQARINCFLQFYFADTYRVRTVSTGAVHQAPRTVLVGPHMLRREDLIQSGNMKIFTIRFTPVGFRALFGMPGHAVTNTAESAELILGNGMHELTDRLADARQDQWQAIAESFLLRLSARCAQTFDVKTTLRMARTMQKSRGAMAISALAADHGLSVRQVERNFLEHIGVSPKNFGRLARLDRALSLAGLGSTGWADVAHAAGYFDQSHMVHEFRLLTGETPVGFATLRQRFVSSQ